jgi:serine/threonine-protein kinase HipA
MHPSTMQSVFEPPIRVRTGVVRIDGQRVGQIEEIEGRTIRFTYDASWVAAKDAVPVSLTLPVRASPYEWTTLHAFFGNLLPEGWLYEIARTKLKIAPDDWFGLLLATCADCVGAVEVAPLS